MPKGCKMRKKCVVCDVAHYTVWDTCGPCAANELEYEARLRPPKRLAKCGHMSTVNRHRCPDCVAEAMRTEESLMVWTTLATLKRCAGL
jgi:hypothetical protein